MWQPWGCYNLVNQIILIPKTAQKVCGAALYFWLCKYLYYYGQVPQQTEYYDHVLWYV